jgi:hypothetical protein
MSLAVIGVAAADSAAELAEGVLGLKWGASTAEITAVYPAARQMAPSHIAVVATTGFWGARSAMGDIFILTVDPQAGFSSVDSQLAGDDVYELIEALEAGLGDGRSASARTLFGAFQHAHEWSTSEFGVRVAYTTMDGASRSSVVGMGAVQAHRGPITRSVVDELQKTASPPAQTP